MLWVQNNSAVVPLILDDEKHPRVDGVHSPEALPETTKLELSQSRASEKNDVEHDSLRTHRPSIAGVDEHVEAEFESLLDTDYVYRTSLTLGSRHRLKVLATSLHQRCRP